MYGVIYKITNKLNGKPYIGQTIQKLSERLKQHRSGNQYIDKVIQKYKWKNFTVEVIEECDTPEQLNEREIFWIAFFNCKAPNGYNLTDGGEGFKGLTEESLAKMRKPKSPEAISRMSAAQKKRSNTPEGKAQLDKARAARWEHEKQRPPEERGWIRRCRKNVYPVLEAELVSRNLKYDTLARHLNMTGTTLARKMNGKVRLTVDEATAIKNFLGVEIPIEELFRRDDGFDADKTFSARKRDWDTYPVLKAELQRQNISTVELAKYLGLSRPTVSRKLQGKVGITPEQKNAIKKFLGVEMSVEELFRRQ